jgi:hypothetical protein
MFDMLKVTLITDLMNYTFLVFLFNPILTNYVNQSLNSEGQAWCSW